MRIVYLSSSIIPSRSANSIHVMKMCQAFAKNGHKVILFARQSDTVVEDHYEYYGVDPCFKIIKCVWPPLRGIGGFLYAQQVKKKVHGLTPDICYGRDLYSLLAVSSLGCPIIYEAHTPPANKVRLYLEGQLLSSNSFKRLVVISNALREEYLNLFPWVNDYITVSHDGADAPIPQRLKDAEFKLPGRNNCVKVGYVGHLYPGKGMEIIVQLARRLPEIDFHVVGGTQEDIKHWESLINNRNVFFHGFKPHGQLGKYYRSFDIVLAPYQRRVAVAGGKGDISKWMSPLKIFEYMAYGKPIIASDLPVLKEVLHNKVNSLLCPPQDIEAWQNALYTLMNDPALRKLLGNKAYKDGVNNYTWDKRGELVLA